MAKALRLLGKALKGASDVATPMAMEKMRSEIVAKRDERLNAFQKGERLEKQTFEAGQGELERANRLEVANSRQSENYKTESRMRYDPDTGEEYEEIYRIGPDGSAQLLVGREGAVKSRDDFDLGNRDSAIEAVRSGALPMAEFRSLAEENGWQPPGSTGGATTQADPTPTPGGGGPSVSPPQQRSEITPSANPQDDIDAYEKESENPPSGGLLDGVARIGSAAWNAGPNPVEEVVEGVKQWLTGARERYNIKKALPQLEEEFSRATGEEKEELGQLIEQARAKLGDKGDESGGSGGVSRFGQWLGNQSRSRK